ncbi:hypothetical protein HLH26_08680 [Gluconacetobacter sp. 1b LMG 1731]|uniref:Uncharacterized protein n=1 Tax=Gluconacetobacter dulcium TaxID=2729096 RepID=A0A7W4IKP6_9PROT|nr:hypothetical protein [Gluconacetobacter dulcium]MBB2164616.1 hypothetical protein [Gluconacetobacter dulcium]MBB2193617.1 hypothetical protein [Gluconacetobacter dulcium]
MTASVETKILFQPYRWKSQKRGPDRLEAAPAIECKIIGDGLRRIEKIRAGGTGFAGAQLVRISVDIEAGDYGEPEFLDEAGHVPARDE